MLHAESGLTQICSICAIAVSDSGALRARNQAQFNPAQYLIGLAKATELAGALVFEKTRERVLRRTMGGKSRLAERQSTPRMLY